MTLYLESGWPGSYWINKVNKLNIHNIQFLSQQILLNKPLIIVENDKLQQLKIEKQELSDRIVGKMSKAPSNKDLEIELDSEIQRCKNDISMLEEPYALHRALSYRINIENCKDKLQQLNDIQLMLKAKYSDSQ